MLETEKESPQYSQTFLTVPSKQMKHFTFTEDVVKFASLTLQNISTFNLRRSASTSFQSTEHGSIWSQNFSK